MPTKAIRVFYRKLDNAIVWRHELEGDGDFPTTVGEALMALPTQVVGFDAAWTPQLLGGTPNDYDCIEEREATRVAAILLSDANIVVNGAVIVGAPRTATPPALPRDIFKEIDQLKAEVALLKV